MFRLKDEFDKMFFGDENPKVKAKKKLNAYYDLYGEDKMKLEDALDDDDYYDYLMASGFADEVLAERRREREKAALLWPDMADRRQQKVANVLADTDKANDNLSMDDKKQQSDAKGMESALNGVKEPKSGEKRRDDEDGEPKLNIEQKLNLLSERSKAHLKDKGTEDSIANIYLDIFGNITVGVGKVINDEKTFMSVNFMINGRPATMEEKRKAYRVFKDLQAKGEYGSTFGADHYENKSPLRVTERTMEDLLEAHLKNDIQRLRSGMPEFDSLPLPLQEVLVDIRYNSGAITKELWPNLRQAIEDKNLSKILANIKRNVNHDIRSKWAQEKIRSIKNWGYWED